MRPMRNLRRLLGRALVAAALLIAASLLEASAFAQAQPQFHDKFYLRLGAGPSYFSDSVESDEPVAGLGVVHGTIKGATLATELTAGYAVSPGLIVGGGLYFHW